MELTYHAIFLSCLIYFIWTDKFTVFLFFFICFSVYFMPVLFGVVNTPYKTYVHQVDMNVPMYYFASFMLLCTIAFDFIYRYVLVNLKTRSSKKRHIDYNNKHYALVLAIIILISFILQVITGGEALFSSTKVDVLEAESRWTLLNVVASMIGVCFYLKVNEQFHQKKLILLMLALALLSLLFNIYIGHRSNAAIAFLSVVFMLLFDKKYIHHVKNNITIVVLIVFVVFMFFIYKFLYIAIKLGDIERLLSILFEDGFLLKAFTYSEPFTVQGIFNEVFAHDYRTDCNNIFIAPLIAVPLLGDVLDFTKCTFSAQVTNDLFSGVEFGIGSNMYAEFYSVSGFLSLYVFSLVFLFFIMLLALSTYNIKSDLFYCVMFVCFAYLCFYSNRKDLIGTFLSLKRVVFVGILISFLAILSKKVLTRK